MPGRTAIQDLLYFCSGRHFFRPLVERSGFIIPEHYLKKRDEDEEILVHWFGENDPENPLNWSFWYKTLVTFQLCILTSFVYLGSSTVTTAIPMLAKDMHVSDTVAALGVSLFVWGYGIGPMILSPLTEISFVGRLWPYIFSIGIFVILQVPTVLVNNIGGYLVLRFLAGFLGSPVLATGGATMGDIWRVDGGFVIGIAFWGFSANGGPALGPLLSGFAVQHMGWRWSIWPLFWGIALVWTVTFLFFPETSADTILTRRAHSLRRVTKRKNIISAGEKRDSRLTAASLAYDTLYRPVYLTVTEPVLLFSDLYIAYLYGILYCFFEAFPLTFQGRHHLSVGKTGAAYISGWIGAAITLGLYILYNEKVVLKRFRSGNWRPEYRMEVCFAGGVLFPISMFWFGWTSFESIHWIVPLLAFAMFQSAVYLLFQGFLGYIGENFPLCMLLRFNF